MSDDDLPRQRKTGNSDSSPNKKFTMNLSETMHRRLNEAADAEGITVSDWMRRALSRELYLAQKGVEDIRFEIEERDPNGKTKKVEVRLLLAS